MPNSTAADRFKVLYTMLTVQDKVVERKGPGGVVRNQVVPSFAIVRVALERATGEITLRWLRNAEEVKSLDVRKMRFGFLREANSKRRGDVWKSQTALDNLEGSAVSRHPELVAKMVPLHEAIAIRVGRAEAEGSPSWSYKTVAAQVEDSTRIVEAIYGASAERFGEG